MIKKKLMDNSANTVIGDVRTFNSGATRDTDKDKLDFDGFEWEL